METSGPRATVGAVVEGGTSVNYKTGGWREFKPIFVAQVAPCMEACPAGIDITGFLREVKLQRYDRAWHIIMEENPFPSVCGRVCGHPCEEACNRKTFDEPLAINSLERFVGDYGLKNKLTESHKRIRKKERIAIVGSGPAGLSCAYHLKRLGYGVKVFDRALLPGGMLTWGIPDYRLPGKILNGEIERLRSMGVEIDSGILLDGDFLRRGLKEFRAIFLALGAQKHVSLGIPGENLQRVLSGLHFLAQVKKGERAQLGNRVLVIGGGNTAIDVARTALRLGSRPTVLYRRTRNEMLAVPSEIDEALKEGIRIEFLTTPVKIMKLKNRKLQLECMRNRMSKPGPDGRKKPVPISGSHFSIESDDIIVAIGEVVDLDGFSQSLNWKGTGVVADKWGKTEVPNIFVGGDLVAGPHTVSHAIGSGKRAALAIDASIRGLEIGRAKSIFLGNQGSFSMARWIEPSSADKQSNRVVNFKDLNFHYWEPRPREKMPQISDIDVRAESFKEVNLGLSEKRAVQEAERCFQCGGCCLCDNCYTFCPDSVVWREGEEEGINIDYEFCKGCGICAHECPSHFIEMVREEK